MEINHKIKNVIAILFCALCINLVVLSHAIAEESVTQLIEKGEKAMQEHQYLQALSYFQRANRLESQNADHLVKVASAYNALGAKESVKKTLEQAITINPNHVETLLWLGKLAFQSRDKELARQYYQRVLNSQPDNSEASRSLTEITEAAN